MRITAMDLGTSNTCVTSCDSQDNHGANATKRVHVLKPEGWHNPALGGAIPTLILYKEGEPFLIGAAAEYEFGEAAEVERVSYDLRGQFKPDIAVHEHARKWMMDFLRLLRERVKPEKHLLVGIPSQAESHYQQALRQCLHETGWENAQFLREPVGAVLHYIATGALPPSLAARGVLTVDFGGGTCDLAILRRADVVGKFGDMLYGGRLFDDLFYQILLDQNPELELRLRSEGNEYYVHWVACRKAKEEFSSAMNQDMTQSVTVRVRWSYFDGRKVYECSAYIENFTWADFLHHAGKYKASKELLSTLGEHGERAGLSARGQGLLQGKRVDLVSWFEDILHETLRDARHDQTTPFADMPQVLLTGGSSAWPFVRLLVTQTLGERAKILMGDEPYADIAKGLAQYHVLAEHLREGRSALKNELPTFMEERIRREAIQQTLNRGSETLLKELEDFLRDVVLLPEFRQYRDKGGTLHKLMANIGTAMVQEEKRIRELLDSAMARMGRNIVDNCRQELKVWFRDKGIPIVPERLEQTWIALEMDQFIARMAEELSNSTLHHDRNNAELATMVAAPGLAALAASGAPLTATVIGVSGLVLMKVFKLDTWVVDKVFLLPVPAFLRRQLFAEKRLEKLCQEQLEAFGKDFKKHIVEQWKESEGRVLAEAARVAAEEIEALDILNITPA